MTWTWWKWLAFIAVSVFLWLFGAAWADELGMRYGTVPGATGYGALLNGTPVAWATPSLTQRVATPAPGETVAVIRFTPGTALTVRVCALGPPGQPTVCSNSITPLGTPTRTSTATATVTTTASATSTATMTATWTPLNTPQLFECARLDLTGNGSVSALDAKVLLDVAVGARPGIRADGTVGLCP